MKKKQKKPDFILPEKKEKGISYSENDKRYARQEIEREYEKYRNAG